MRQITVALVLLLSGFATPLSAQASSAAPCPPPDSLYTDRPPGVARDLLSYGSLYPRYATYVIDSVYVLANQLQIPGAGVDSIANLLKELTPNDIEQIEIVKGKRAAQWNTCLGVPTILIVTKSKTWRPSHLHPRSHTP